MSSSQTNHQPRRWAVLLGLCLVIAGCASGPPFRPVDSVPQGNGLIYIYRPSTMHGAALVPYVVINESRALPLRTGGYYTYISPPGPITISITHTAQRTVNFDVKSGETYYVKGGTIFMGLGIPYIEQTSAELGLKEIADCKLLPDTFAP